MISADLIILISVIIGIGALWNMFDKIIFPWIINIRTSDIDLNPKWIISEAKHYYGFSDIDFVIVESPLGMTPRFRISKNKKRLQLLIDNDTTTNDINDILHVALVGKLKLNYGLWFPDKPLYWLSILCYMLDGGDIKEESTSWENVDKKGVDLPK